MPFLVAESPSGQLLGYALVAPWKQKRAYRFTVENSIYLGPAAAGKGLGRALLAELIDRSKAAGLKEIIAVIADQGADASIALHEKFGFQEIGRMGRVGFKFDRWLGTVLLQKSLK
jgi:L-amino acid N-acyltransferase YncA